MNKKLVMLSLLCALTGGIDAEESLKLLAFSGSTRGDSLNKKLVIEAADIAHQMGAKITYVDLKDYLMPFYDADLEANCGMPEKAKQLRQLMTQNHVILIASPEYNASMSAVLKNALDWASRGENGGPSRDAFKGKKFGIMSVSPGKGGGARGLTPLRAVIEDVGGTVLVEQVSIPQGNTAFDKNGHLVDQKQRNEIFEMLKRAFYN